MRALRRGMPFIVLVTEGASCASPSAPALSATVRVRLRVAEDELPCLTSNSFTLRAVP